MTGNKIIQLRIFIKISSTQTIYTMKLFKLLLIITAILGWLEIVAFPLLIGISTGFIIHLSKPGKKGIILWVIVALLGILIGVIRQTKVEKIR